MAHNENLSHDKYLCVVCNDKFIDNIDLLTDGITLQDAVNWKPHELEYFLDPSQPSGEAHQCNE